MFRAQPPLGPITCLNCAAECDLAAVSAYRAIAKDTNTKVTPAAPLVVLCSRCTAARLEWVLTESAAHPYIDPRPY
jgi:hypothetical protein